MMNTPNWERMGIAKLEKVFADMGWLFREQPISDYGIDAQVEIMENDRPTGQLIAIQIKSGKSYCKENANGDIVYYPDEKHIEYWQKHALPVVIVIYNPGNDKAYWEPVVQESVEKTEKGYKIIFDKKLFLEKESHIGLKKIFKLNPIKYRFEKLLLDLPLMHLLQNNTDIFIEYEDWKNKSLSRTSITIHIPLSDGNEKQINLPTIYAPHYSTLDIIRNTFPWAEIEMDIDSYQQEKEELYECECLQDHDEETGQSYYYPPFDEWYKEPNGIVPIREDSEIDVYRVKLTLNELGKAFLLVEEYLSEKSAYDVVSFSIDDVS